jgi:anti-sigma factor RsiW
MMDDATARSLMEAALRRELSASERQALKAWLAGHPEAHTALADEVALTHLLRKLPEAPLTPDFTERVLRAVEASERAANAPARRWAWFGLPAWSWRAATAMVALGATLLVVQVQHRTTERRQMAESAVTVASLAEIPSAEALANFEVISRLPTGPLPDERDLARALE